MTAVLTPPRAGRTASTPCAPSGAAPAASRARRWAPSLDALFTAVFALFGFGVGIQRLSDNSFFTHLATGRLILDRGLPRADVFSYTAPGSKWVLQSWLAEVLYAALERSVGGFGIRVLGALTGAAITVLVFRLALRLTGDRTRAALLSVAALGGLYLLWSERPLLLGVLFLVVLVWIVEVPDCWVGRHPVGALVVLFWLWANVHGSFALGFVYLGLHLVGRGLDGRWPWEGRERRLLLGSAAAFAVTFLNPYGPALVLFPVELMRRGEVLRDVIEWMSPDFRTARGQVYLLWVAVFVVAVARAPRRVSRRDLLVTVPFLLLGFWALRNVALAPLVGLPVVARAVAVEPRPEPAGRRDLAAPVAWLLGALIAGLAVVLLGRAAGQADFVETPYPVAAMDAMQARGLVGTRLLMDDADAAYPELVYGTAQPVFLDDRYDMFPPRVVADFMSVSRAEPGYTRILERYGVETVIWDKSRPLVRLLRASGDWTEVHRDRTWVLLVRSDLRTDVRTARP